MAGSYFSVSCAWRNRAEDERSCAERTAKVLSHVVGLGFPVEGWRAGVEEGPDYEARFRDVELGGVTPDHISQLTARDRVLPGVGAHFQATYGPVDGAFASIHVRCGGVTIGNHASVYVDTTFQRVNVALGLLRTAVEAFEPNFAMVMPSPGTARRDDMLAYTAPFGRPHRAMIEWITFLAAERGTVPPLPQPVKVITEVLGSYVVLADDPAQVTSELVGQVTDSLLGAGLLDHPDDM